MPTFPLVASQKWQHQPPLQPLKAVPPRHMHKVCYWGAPNRKLCSFATPDWSDEDWDRERGREREEKREQQEKEKEEKQEGGKN